MANFFNTLFFIDEGDLRGGLEEDFDEDRDEDLDADLDADRDADLEEDRLLFADATGDGDLDFERAARMICFKTFI